MTDPKTSETQKISISTLANDLGVSNPDLFKVAFNQLRTGTVPDDSDSQRELSDAFLRVLTADASTTQRVVNRLRAIYRKSASGATSA
jgi:transposase-like protein